MSATGGHPHDDAGERPQRRRHSEEDCGRGADADEHPADPAERPRHVGRPGNDDGSGHGQQQQCRSAVQDVRPARSADQARTGCDQPCHRSAQQVVREEATSPPAQHGGAEDHERPQHEQGVSRAPQPGHRTRQGVHDRLDSGLEVRPRRGEQGEEDDADDAAEGQQEIGRGVAGTPRPTTRRRTSGRRPVPVRHGSGSLRSFDVDARHSQHGGSHGGEPALGREDVVESEGVDLLLESARSRATTNRTPRSSSSSTTRRSAAAPEVSRLVTASASKMNATTSYGDPSTASRTRDRKYRRWRRTGGRRDGRRRHPGTTWASLRRSDVDEPAVLGAPAEHRVAGLGAAAHDVEDRQQDGEHAARGAGPRSASPAR